MKFLRTVSTRRLLAMIVGLVAAIAVGTAIAVAASGPGPVPARTSLAKAIRGAVAAPAAPAVTGIYARISFTNHLIDASNIQGTDPILQGASGRLWVSTSSTNYQLRLELQGDNGDAQVVVDNGSFWIYDPTSNTVYEGTIPQAADKTTKGKKHEAADSGALPSTAQIQSDLNQLTKHVDLSGAIPSDVGGRPAYTVRVSPQHDAGLLGAVELAWDSQHGIPLRIAVYARGDGSPVLELKATSVSYGPVSAGVFDIKPPSGAKVVKLSSPATPAAAARAARAHAKHGTASKEQPVTGAAAVASHLSFKLLAPKSLVGLPRQSVQLLDWGGSPAALVTYGQNLGGIAVIEQPATATGSQSATTQSQSGNGDQQGLSLPSISINGATGHELDTALGTMVQFTRGGVSYTVIGSVTPWAAELAARRL
jgi:outer membrane lipoprotein-sorting protein